MIGTGLTSNKRQQMAALSYNAVKAVEGWLVENPQWFAPTGPVPDPPVDPNAPRQAAPAPTMRNADGSRHPRPPTRRKAATPVETTPLAAPAAASAATARATDA